jgi:quinol monooxygenase YgiN
MIVRIVQMTFRESEVENFQALFRDRKELIRHFEGCTHLELWQDAQKPNIFFTYSYWENEEFLDRYRFSELFKETWALTKALFAEKPNAWSVNRKIVV